MKYRVSDLLPAGWILVVVTAAAVIMCGLPYGAWLQTVLPNNPPVMSKVTFLLGLAPLVGVAVLVFWMGSRLLNGLGIPVVRRK